MAAHKHADLIKQMVDDDTLRAVCSEWPDGSFEAITVIANPHEDWKLRPPTPKTITIVCNGKTYELPEPMRLAPRERGDAYYLCTTSGNVEANEWTNHEIEVEFLEQGVCHATREAAQAWVDAMAEIRGAK